MMASEHKKRINVKVAKVSEQRKTWKRQMPALFFFAAGASFGINYHRSPKLQESDKKTW